MIVPIVLCGLLLIGGLVVLALIGSWIGERRWQRESQRLAPHHERLAASNGRPHSEAVIQGATPRREP